MQSYGGKCMAGWYANKPGYCYFLFGNDNTDLSTNIANGKKTVGLKLNVSATVKLIIAISNGHSTTPKLIPSRAIQVIRPTTRKLHPIR